MSLIASLRPLLKGPSTVVLTLSEEQGSLVALIQPRLLKIDADTNDEELAALQMALSRPLKVKLTAEGDPDVELAEALRTMGQSRTVTADQLASYCEAQAEAANAASLAKEKKASASKATPTKGKPALAAPSNSAGASAPAAEAAPLPEPTTTGTEQAAGSGEAAQSDAPAVAAKPNDLFE